MVCSAPSSVTMKSFAVSPSRGLPLLSFTFTVSTTNWLLVEKLAVVSPRAGVFWPICCAQVNCTAKKRIMVRRLILKSHDKSYYQTSHRIGRTRRGKAELRVAKGGVPTGVGNVVEWICRIDPQIAAQPVSQSEGAASRSIQTKLRRTDDGIPSSVAKFSR